MNGCIRDATLSEVYLEKFGTPIELPVKRTLKECFDIFGIIHKVVNDLNTLRRVAQEVLNDMLADNVYYIEIRTTPKSLAGASKRDYVNTLIDIIRVFFQLLQLH